MIFFIKASEAREDDRRKGSDGLLRSHLPRNDGVGDRGDEGGRMKLPV